MRIIAKTLGRLINENTRFSFTSIREYDKIKRIICKANFYKTEGFAWNY